MLGSTYNGLVPMWYVVGSSNNELAIISIVSVVKSRGSGRATAAAACIEGGICTRMMDAGASSESLRVFSASLRESFDDRRLLKLCPLNLGISSSHIALRLFCSELISILVVHASLQLELSLEKRFQPLKLYGQSKSRTGLMN